GSATPALHTVNLQQVQVSWTRLFGFIPATLSTVCVCVCIVFSVCVCVCVCIVFSVCVCVCVCGDGCVCLVFSVCVWRWPGRSEAHTSELQSHLYLVCRRL